MRKLSAHQAIRISCWIDAIEAKQRVRRRCAMNFDIETLPYKNWHGDK